MKTYLHYNIDDIERNLREDYPAVRSIFLKHNPKGYTKKDLSFDNSIVGWEILIGLLDTCEKDDVSRIFPKNQYNTVGSFITHYMELKVAEMSNNIYLEKLDTSGFDATRYIDFAPTAVAENLASIVEGPLMAKTKVVSFYYNTERYAYCLSFAYKGKGSTLAIDMYDTERGRFRNCGVVEITNSKGEIDHNFVFSFAEPCHWQVIYSICKSIPKIVKDYFNPKMKLVSVSVHEPAPNKVNVKNDISKSTPEHHEISEEARSILIKMRTNTKYYRECKEKGIIRKSSKHSTHARPVEHKAYYRERVLKDGTVRHAFYIVKNAGVPCTAKHRTITVTKL